MMGVCRPSRVSLAQYLLCVFLYLNLLGLHNAGYYALFVDDKRGAERAEILATVHAFLTPHAKFFHQFLFGICY